jgi:hypothetical protein
MTASEQRRDRMSDLDKAFAELEAKRSQQDVERRERFRSTAEFLKDFFESDIKPSKTLQRHGIEAHFVDNKIVLHKSQSAHYAEPLYIVVGEQGEIDIGGRSFGRYQPAERATKKSELIQEIISFFDL